MNCSIYKVLELNWNLNFYKHPTYLTSTFVLLTSDVYMNQQRLDSSNSKPISIVNFTAHCKGLRLKIK